MKTDLKNKIVNLTNWIILVIVILVAVWFYAFIIITTFDLKVFAERTTGFFSLSILGALAIVGCSAILNIGINLSIIAESKKARTTSRKKTRPAQKALLVALALLVLIPALLFLGDHLSKVKLERWFISEATQLVKRYDRTITKISTDLSSPKEIGQIPKLLQFLSEHKAEYPDIQLIVQAKYDGQQVYLKITKFTDSKDLKQPLFNNSFFQSDEEVSRYLSSIFQGKGEQNYFYKKGEDVFVFVPVKKAKGSFVLAFIKYQRYGKFGS